MALLDQGGPFPGLPTVVNPSRHNEVLSRYLTDRLDGLTYPMPANERDLFDSILSESRWYLKTIALQLVAETCAVPSRAGLLRLLL